MMKSLRTLTGALLLSSLLLGGCTDVGTNGVTSANGLGDAGSGAGGSGVGTLTLVHPGGVQPRTLERANVDRTILGPSYIPHGVDTLEITFLDASGRAITEPIEYPAQPSLVINNVPLRARYMDIDYLRNGGYVLHEDREPIQWLGATALVNTPDPTAAVASTTAWKTSVDSNGRAHLTLSSDGGADQEFLIRGVGYSPIPIGDSAKVGPGIGDLFWDTPGGFLDFERVWKRDIENIRSNGFNMVRVYSMIAHFFYDDGRIPLPSEFQNANSLRIRQHKKFLDECWNNGKNPIYVLVGVPMPDAIFIKALHDDPNRANEVTFWNDNFAATLEQLKDHPAVLGFTMFNEIGGQPDFVGDPTKAQFYWGQVKKFSEQAKLIAPNKLIGWAFNDDSVFASQTVALRQANAQKVDFYGVNAFQADQLASTLDPWQANVQGSAARPVILTEFGLPASRRTDNSTIQPYKEPGLTAAKAEIASREGVDVTTVQPLTGDINLSFPSLASALSIVADTTSINVVVTKMRDQINRAFSNPIVTGVVYFEWCDEWWKQDPYAPFSIPDSASPDPNARKPVNLINLSWTRQEGGQPNAGFPGLYGDEEAFGLNSIALGNRPATAVYTDNLGGVGANVQVDILTPRATLQMVKEAYANAFTTRNNALGNP